MAEHEWDKSTDPLEAELYELGRYLDVPPAPPVVAAVRARLETGDPGSARRHRAWRQAVLKAAAIAAVFVAGLLVVSPQVRAAVADLLRFAGIEIHQNGEEPPVPADSRYAPLPGERVVTLETARELADFRILVPTGLGEPDVVTVADGEPPRVVSLLYYDGAAPSAGPTPVRADPDVRIDEFHGTISPVFSKYVDAKAEPIALGAYLAFWIDQPHPVLYVDRNGEFQEETTRLSGPSLIVEMGGTTVRIEADFGKDRAIEVARSLG